MLSDEKPSNRLYQRIFNKASHPSADVRLGNPSFDCRIAKDEQKRIYDIRFSEGLVDCFGWDFFAVYWA